MAEILPLFPLQIVVFPGEDVNLHIFEPRYKELIADCEAQGITFGIPAYFDDQVQSIGTELELREIVHRHPGGELDIRTRGLGLFAIQTFMEQAPGKLYAGGRVERLSYDTQANPAMAEQILERVSELYRLLSIDKPLPEDPGKLRIYDLGHTLGLNLQQEYQLLGMLREFERQQFVLAHLEQVLPVVRRMQDIRRKASMNGHFRNLKPPAF